MHLRRPPQPRSLASILPTRRKPVIAVSQQPAEKDCSRTRQPRLVAQDALCENRSYQQGTDESAWTGASTGEERQRHKPDEGTEPALAHEATPSKACEDAEGRLRCEHEACPQHKGDTPTP